MPKTWPLPLLALLLLLSAQGARAVDRAPAVFHPPGFKLAIAMPKQGEWFTSSAGGDGESPVWSYYFGEAESTAIYEMRLILSELDMEIVPSIYGQLRDSFRTGAESSGNLMSDWWPEAAIRANGREWVGSSAILLYDGEYPVRAVFYHSTAGNRMYTLCFYCEPMYLLQARQLIAETIASAIPYPADEAEDVVLQMYAAPDYGLEMLIPVGGELSDYANGLEPPEQPSQLSLAQQLMLWHGANGPLLGLLVIGMQSDESLDKVRQRAIDYALFGVEHSEWEEVPLVNQGRPAQWRHSRGLQQVSEEGLELSVQHELYLAETAGQFFIFDFLLLEDAPAAAQSVIERLLNSISLPGGAIAASREALPVAFGDMELILPGGGLLLREGDELWPQGLGQGASAILMNLNSELVASYALSYKTSRPTDLLSLSESLRQVAAIGSRRDDFDAAAIGEPRSQQIAGREWRSIEMQVDYPGAGSLTLCLNFTTLGEREAAVGFLYWPELQAEAQTAITTALASFKVQDEAQAQEEELPELQLPGLMP
jgi:hypothetical protein